MNSSNNSKVQLIKLVLKTHFSHRKYAKEELPNFVNDVIATVNEECKDFSSIENNDIVDILALHTHLNKEQLYFVDITRSREKFIEKYTKMFNDFVTVTTNVKPTIKTSSTKLSTQSTKLSTRSTKLSAQSTKSSVSKTKINEISSDLVKKSSSSLVRKPVYPPPKLTYESNVKTPFYNFTYTVKRCSATDEYNGPYGTQWIHDTQVDDVLTPIEKIRMEQFKKLRAVVLPEQRSEEWFAMRNGKITASDGGCVLGMNHYEPTFNFVIKKIEPSFQNNMHCYHGKKYEQIATSIYEYRMNVHVEEFGLMGHPEYNFLGASPDGICSPYKKDKKHLSKYVGRMLEIKCPVTRKINKSGEIKDHICPIYYWVQVQLQLECCDLDECDFWQCSIYEYTSRSEYIQDTDPKEPFRSKKTGYEKGCLIQLLPKTQAAVIAQNPKSYLDIVYADASFIYPDNIEMSPPEYDEWILKTLENVEKDPKYANVYVDRVIYWRLAESKNVLIERNKEWFNQHLPTLKKVWSYVEFFRLENGMDFFKIFNDYVRLTTKGVDRRDLEHYNDSIMETLDKICNGEKTSDEYKAFIKELVECNEKSNSNDTIYTDDENQNSDDNIDEQEVNNFDFDSDSDSDSNVNNSSISRINNKNINNYEFDSDSDSD